MSIEKQKVFFAPASSRTSQPSCLLVVGANIAAVTASPGGRGRGGRGLATD